MDKIKVLLEKDRISFSYYKKPLSNKKQDLLNTNIISRNELTFTEDYLIDNSKMVRGFIKELIEDQNKDYAYDPQDDLKKKLSAVDKIYLENDKIIIKCKE